MVCPLWSCKPGTTTLRPKGLIVLQVQQELQWQVRRTSWHPSVVIWGGNNEIEIAMGNWFQPTVDNPRLYIADYVELFLNTVEAAVAGVNPQLIFVDSSPSNGLISREPYVKR